MTSNQAFESIAFLSGADKNKYGQVFDDLEIDQMKYVDSFPKILIDAYNFLYWWKEIHTGIPVLIHPMIESNFTTRSDKNDHEEHIITPEEGETALATKGKRIS
jgi:hypothetical protein